MSKQLPLFKDGGIEAFSRREVPAYVPYDWVDDPATKAGVSFTKHLYAPAPPQTLKETRADIRALDRECGGLLGEAPKAATQ
jgi:hypothetical protein